MTCIKRRYQHTLFSCHTQPFTHTLLHSSPLWKRFGFLPSKSLSFSFPYLRFGFCWNSFNSQLSFTLEDNLLQGSGGSPYRNWWDPWNETGSKWEDPVLPEGVWGISLYWTLAALKLLYNIVLWWDVYIPLVSTCPISKKHIVYKICNSKHNNNNNNNML